MILQFCEPRNFSLCPRRLVGVCSGGLGVWFMTFCCCLVEFGSSCFNHAWIESRFVWFGPWYSTAVSKQLYIVKWENSVSYANKIKFCSKKRTVNGVFFFVSKIFCSTLIQWFHHPVHFSSLTILSKNIVKSIAFLFLVLCPAEKYIM